MNLDRNLTHVIKNPPKTPRPYLYTQNILNLCYNKKKNQAFREVKEELCRSFRDLIYNYNSLFFNLYNINN